MPEDIVSTSEFFGGAPEFEDGDAFLDGCLLVPSASEPSLGDAAAVGGRDGLPVLAAVGCDLGAMACVTVDAWTKVGVEENQRNEAPTSCSAVGAAKMGGMVSLLE